MKPERLVPVCLHVATAGRKQTKALFTQKLSNTLGFYWLQRKISTYKFVPLFITQYYMKRFGMWKKDLGPVCLSSIILFGLFGSEFSLQ